jgi:hypothetical protein
MDINFIITCFDKEEYLHGMIDTIHSYRKIVPKYAVCYNGNIKEFPCDVRLGNNGHQLGDIDLTLAGYNFLKHNGSNRFIKLSIDSWLLDEHKIIEIFDFMERQKSCYAGNYWFSEDSQSLATDIIFSCINHGNIFENFSWDGQYFETSMFSTIVKINSNITIIEDRKPVVPRFRFECPSLSWAMHHDLKDNLQALWLYKSKN